MLKHASNASGAGSASATTAVTSTVTANGQLRNSSSNAAQQQQPRSIHLRPPQPLNISAISAASLANNLQTSKTSASTAAAAAAASSTNTGLNGSTANGGQRIPTATLLNLTHGGGNGVNGGSGGGAGSTTATTTTPVTPITPIIPNGNAIGISSSLGIGNNLHTYTNQHITATNPHSTSSNNILNSTAISTTTNNANHNYSNCRNLVTTPTPVPAPLSATTLQQTLNKIKHGPGPREALTSLGLLCLVSLLLALLSLIFLLKISPNGREQSGSRNSNEDFIIVYDVTLALCALSLSLNLCCLLVCAIQFLFAVKLLRSPMFNGRDNKYLEKSSISRTCAVGGFFISIPIFLTGIILYTLNHFHSTPAIITSVLIGIGIIFCGCAMVHNVFVWQKEKTISYRNPTLLDMSTITQQLQQLQPSHQHQQSTQAHSIGPVTPPAQFLNAHNNHHNHYYQLNANNNNNNSNNNATTTSHYNSLNQCHGQQTLSPLQLLQQQQFHQQQLHQLHNHQNHHHNHLHSHIQQHGLVQGGLGPSMTPVSPNHSHGSFNPLLAGTINSSFLMRPATATPPTPKPIGGGLSAAQSALARATSPHGSVSPGQGPGLDMSNITNASLHELSTLV